jgi:hypothetical protein
MAGIDNKVYELAGTGPTLPTATYTHPNAGWRWSTSRSPRTPWWRPVPPARSPRSTASPGHVYRCTSASAWHPDRAAAGGGEGLCLYNYTGETLAIGTSVGLRVGVFQSFYGTFSYGSLTFPSRLEDARSR